MTSQQSVIAMLWRNTAYCVKLSDEDSSRYSNKIESDVTITIISQSLPHIMAATNSWHRYGVKKLRHCHPTYLAYRLLSKKVFGNTSAGSFAVWSSAVGRDGLCPVLRGKVSRVTNDLSPWAVGLPQWLRAQHFLSK